ncbi:hypothetical protein L1887_17822 [Cichorium endivia]|nr:hypothetical protein L1887_17822 [Cichorium endivia]
MKGLVLKWVVDFIIGGVNRRLTRTVKPHHRLLIFFCTITPSHGAFDDKQSRQSLPSPPSLFNLTKLESLFNILMFYRLRRNWNRGIWDLLTTNHESRFASRSTVYLQTGIKEIVSSGLSLPNHSEISSMAGVDEAVVQFVNGLRALVQVCSYKLVIFPRPWENVVNFYSNVVKIATVEVPEIHMGSVVELLGKRRGQMVDMKGLGKDVQDIFKMTPHDKQVMMFSATLSNEIQPFTVVIKPEQQKDDNTPESPIADTLIQGPMKSSNSIMHDQTVTAPIQENPLNSEISPTIEQQSTPISFVFEELPSIPANFEWNATEKEEHLPMNLQKSSAILSDFDDMLWIDQPIVEESNHYPEALNLSLGV